MKRYMKCFSKGLKSIEIRLGEIAPNFKMDANVGIYTAAGVFYRREWRGEISYAEYI
jgi:hypothetical protein